MNIYRVTNIDTGEEYTGTTDEVMDKFYITRDNLSWVSKNDRIYAGFKFKKIGDDGRKGCHKKKNDTPKKEKKNGLEEDLKRALELGISYGQYKNKYYWGA